eukprot:2216183-Lingulodinium_polyedra.AAC.1
MLGATNWSGIPQAVEQDADDPWAEMTDVPVGSEGDKGVPVQSKGSGDAGSSPGDEAALESISRRPTQRGGILPE